MVEVVEVMHRVLCMSEAVEGRLCPLEVPEVLEVQEVIRCVLLRILAAVEGRLCLLEELEVLEVMRCGLLGMLEPRFLTCPIFALQF